MIFDIHPSASDELDNAVRHYEKIQEGLGIEFLEEVYATIQRILRFPEAWVKISKYCRRCLTHRFPFGVIYQIEESKIRVIAVMQLNRKPGYWKNRVIR